MMPRLKTPTVYLFLSLDFYVRDFKRAIEYNIYLRPNVCFGVMDPITGYAYPYSPI